MHVLGDAAVVVVVVRNMATTHACRTMHTLFGALPSCMHTRTTRKGCFGALLLLESHAALLLHHCWWRQQSLLMQGPTLPTSHFCLCAHLSEASSSGCACFQQLCLTVHAPCNDDSAASQCKG